MRAHVDYHNMDIDLFSRILMNKCKEAYENESDIKKFANRMLNLWVGLPGTLQNREPFWTLSYANDPLSWGDEEQTRKIYEQMFGYYGD